MTTNRIRAILFATSCVLVLAACDRKPEAPDIPFATYGEGYASKPDLAAVEHQHPLTVADLDKITPENLAALDQERIDQIYARLSAGPIPDGAFEGGIVFPGGVSGKKRLTEILQTGSGGIALALKGALTEKTIGAVDAIGEGLWKGKVFYRQQRVLRNRIEDLATLKAAGLVEGDPQKIEVSGRDAWLLFPAKLYCGQSLLDSRRESIIIDYAFTDEVEGYMEKPDYLAGRRGLKVRDEIRMVRPGFYLGRAYIDRVFVLNFTLYNEDIAKREQPAFAQSGKVAEDCWGGTQARALLAGK
ncbi:MAG: hypothetical protein REI94_14980 [Moraxellaceae bacterium]|nr:hypothetical protein [Moraxellaceae bacterium]